MIRKQFVILVTFLLVSPLFANVNLTDTLQVYELVHEGKTYSIFTINRTDRFALSPYQSYLTETLLMGAREWYLALHEKQGSFTNPEAIRADFTTGSESLHDGRSTFSIILEGKAQDLVNELVAQNKILDRPQDFYRGMIRISTASYNNRLPPFYGRLGFLPQGFTQGYDTAMTNDWAELKNLAQDKDLKIDFLPLALRSIERSGWVDLGGFLQNKNTGEVFYQGDPWLIDPKLRNSLDIGDAYEMYHQKDLHKSVLAPDPIEYENSRVSQYYLEVLVPEVEAEGITNPKKAKGLLAYYYRQGFKVLDVIDDPTQPRTKVVIAGIDRDGWFKIIENSRRRRGLELLKVPVHEINFSNPNEVTRQKPKAISCRSLFR